MGSKNDYAGLDPYAVKLIKHKARRLVGSAGFVEADQPDLEQDLVVDLLQRLPRFNPALAKIETFINRLVEHHVATIIEAQKAELRDYRRRAGSLDEQRESEAGDAADVPPVLDSKEYRRETLSSARSDEELRDLRIDLSKTIGELPDDLRSLCDRLQTAPVNHISRETGVPRGTVYGGIARLRAQFERAGLAVYVDGSDTLRSAPVRKQVSTKKAPTTQRKQS